MTFAVLVTLFKPNRRPFWMRCTTRRCCARLYTLSWMECRTRGPNAAMRRGERGAARRG